VRETALPSPAVAPIYAEEEPQPQANEADDDRAGVKPGDSILLVVENDLSFASGRSSS